MRGLLISKSLSIPWARLTHVMREDVGVSQTRWRDEQNVSIQRFANLAKVARE